VPWGTAERDASPGRVRAGVVGVDAEARRALVDVRGTQGTVEPDRRAGEVRQAHRGDPPVEKGKDNELATLGCLGKAALLARVAAAYGRVSKNGCASVEIRLMLTLG